MSIFSGVQKTIVKGIAENALLKTASNLLEARHTKNSELDNEQFSYTMYIRDKKVLDSYDRILYYKKWNPLAHSCSFYDTDDNQIGYVKVRKTLIKKRIEEELGINGKEYTVYKYPKMKGSKYSVPGLEVNIEAFDFASTNFYVTDKNGNTIGRFAEIANNDVVIESKDKEFANIILLLSQLETVYNSIALQ